MLADEDPLVARHIRERWRRAWINRFRKRQRTARRWIEFGEIATWCARSTTGSSREVEQQAANLTFQRLANSVAQGEFEVDGRSKILYLTPRVLTLLFQSHPKALSALAQRTLADFGRSPSSRLTRRMFQAAQTTDPIPVLMQCWVPREMARCWLEAQGYPLPPYLSQTHGFSPAALSELETEFVAWMKTQRELYGTFPPRNRSKKSDRELYLKWASAHGVSRTTVDRWVKARGLRQSRGHPKKSAENNLAAKLPK